MTSCDYCEHLSLGCEFCEHDAHPPCDGCGARCCEAHVKAEGDVYLCNPDPNTWPGRGCYKPPVAEVACIACGKPTSDLHADIPIHVGCRPKERPCAST